MNARILAQLCIELEKKYPEILNELSLLVAELYDVEEPAAELYNAAMKILGNKNS